jgi:hypothetical protein
MITQDELKSKLHYDPDTGIFTWINSYGTAKKGSIAGCFNSNGYTIIRINKKGYRSHRLAWLYCNGIIPEYVDHINGNIKDNRLCNLRECTIQQNAFNSKLRVDSTSKIKGITWHKNTKKWQARVCVNYKSIYIGIFNNINEAKLAVEKYRIDNHKEFARHA